MLSRFLRQYAITASIAATLLLTACQRAETGSEKIDASNFAGWHSAATQHLTTDQGTALESSLQELKLQAMTNGASGSAAIDQAVYQKVNGKTVSEAIQLGFAAKLARLHAQRDQIDTFLAKNAQLGTKHGDTASSDYLAHRREDQIAQRDAVDRQIADTEDQLKRLGIAVPAVTSRPAAPPGATSQTSPTPSAPSPSTASSSVSEQPDSAPVPIHK